MKIYSSKSLVKKDLNTHTTLLLTYHCKKKIVYKPKKQTWYISHIFLCSLAQHVHHIIGQANTSLHCMHHTHHYYCYCVETHYFELQHWHLHILHVCVCVYVILVSRIVTKQKKNPHESARKMQQIHDAILWSTFFFFLLFDRKLLRLCVVLHAHKTLPAMIITFWFEFLVWISP